MLFPKAKFSKMSLIDDNKIEYQMNMNQLTKLSFIPDYI